MVEFGDDGDDENCADEAAGGKRWGLLSSS